jgi:hypothetical protein
MILSEIQRFCFDGGKNVNNLIVDSIELEFIKFILLLPSRIRVLYDKYQLQIKNGSSFGFLNAFRKVHKKQLR